MKELIRKIYAIILTIILVIILAAGVLLIISYKNNGDNMLNQPASTVNSTYNNDSSNNIKSTENYLTKDKTTQDFSLILDKMHDENITKEEMISLINDLDNLYRDIEYYNQFNVDEHVSRLTYRLRDIVNSTNNLADSREDINEILDVLEKDCNELKEIPNKHED